MIIPGGWGLGAGGYQPLQIFLTYSCYKVSHRLRPIKKSINNYELWVG